MEATGVKRSTLRKLCQNGVTSPRKPGPKTQRVLTTVDEFDQGAIRRIIQNLYANKTWPTIKKKNHSEVQHQLGFAGSESSLRRILKHMGYKYRKRQSRDC